MGNEDTLSNIASPTIIREELGGVTYEGRSAFPFPQTSAAVWQIKRTVRSGPSTITQYAVEENAIRDEWHHNNVKTNCIWDDRESYFDPITPEETTIVDDPIPVGVSYSGVIDVRGLIGFSLQAIYTGAPALGANTISIQASVDKTAWADLLDSDKSISGDGDYLWVVGHVYYNYIRIKFDFDTIIPTKIIYSDRRYP